MTDIWFGHMALLCLSTCFRASLWRRRRWNERNESSEPASFDRRPHWPRRRRLTRRCGSFPRAVHQTSSPIPPRSIEQIDAQNLNQHLLQIDIFSLIIFFLNWIKIKFNYLKIFDVISLDVISISNFVDCFLLDCGRAVHPHHSGVGQRQWHRIRTRVSVLQEDSRKRVSSRRAISLFFLFYLFFSLSSACASSCFSAGAGNR